MSHALRRQAEDDDAPEFSDDGEGSLGDEESDNEESSEWIAQPD
jgi:hypothetical protein